MNVLVNSGYPLTIHQAGTQCNNNCAENLSGDYFGFANHYGPMKIVGRGKMLQASSSGSAPTHPQILALLMVLRRQVVPIAPTAGRARTLEPRGWAQSAALDSRTTTWPFPRL